jgi:CRISPR-associated endoribonuclease Cas6
MIASQKIKFEISEKNNYNYNISSLLHGVLMEHINDNYANDLHISALKPYTQNLKKADEDNTYIWTINTLNSDAYDNIIMPLLSDKFKKFTIKNKGVQAKIIEKNLFTCSYSDLIQKYYVKETTKRILKLELITPTAFKSMGEYVFMPDIRLIYQSLMNKYDTFSNDYTIKSEEALEHLIDNTKIIDYRLRSTRFHMEGVKIPAFLGNIVIKINGAETMVNLVNMLFNYGVWAGVGIKTSLGMGALQVV